MKILILLAVPLLSFIVSYKVLRTTNKVYLSSIILTYGIIFLYTCYFVQSRLVTPSAFQFNEDLHLIIPLSILNIPFLLIRRYFKPYSSENGDSQISYGIKTLFYFMAAFVLLIFGYTSMMIYENFLFKVIVVIGILSVPMAILGLLLLFID